MNQIVEKTPDRAVGFLGHLGYVNSHDVSETAPRKGQTKKKKNFRRSASATLLCVYVERREVSLLSNCLLCCD